MGNLSTFKDTATFKDLAEKDKTYLWKAHGGDADRIEYTLDVVLAHNEARHQVDQWLDVLNNPKTSKRTRTSTLKKLKAHTQELQWLQEKLAIRQEVAQKGVKK